MFCYPSLCKRRGWHEKCPVGGDEFINLKRDYIHRTNNLILLKAAKDLSRELRKSQTNAEKIFWKISEYLI
jgi:hypothetical protein